jgi:hypothetical protein
MRDRIMSEAELQKVTNTRTHQLLTWLQVIAKLQPAGSAQLLPGVVQSFTEKKRVWHVVLSQPSL